MYQTSRLEWPRVRSRIAALAASVTWSLAGADVLPRRTIGGMPPWRAMER
jgi:hypothetical protein